jgi:hypothetical protein
MDGRAGRIAAGVAVIAICAVFATAQRAGAKEPVDAPMPPQRKVDHPFVKEVLGTWAWSSKTGTGQPEAGTETFRLGLLDTAVVDDVDGTSMGRAFEGHGVWKVSDDGASIAAWWFFSANPGVKAFRGTLAADGYDVRNDEGERITLKKTATGLEMKAWKGETETRTVTFTKR